MVLSQFKLTCATERSRALRVDVEIYLKQAQPLIANLALWM